MTGDGRADAARRFGDIQGFHVDPATTAPLLVIELDDRSHGTSSSARRDRFKDAVLKAAARLSCRVSGGVRAGGTGAADRTVHPRAAAMTAARGLETTAARDGRGLRAMTPLCARRSCI